MLLNEALNEAQRTKTYLRIYAHSEDSDQIAHSRSLIKIFTEHISDSQGCKVSSSGQRRLLSDWAESEIGCTCQKNVRFPTLRPIIISLALDNYY